MTMETVTKETIESKLGYEESAETSPLPWHRGGDGCVYDANGSVVCDCVIMDRVKNWERGKVWRANAELIVEAVNALFDRKNAKGDRA